jgi:hypothetical protein
MNIPPAFPGIIFALGIYRPRTKTCATIFEKIIAGRRVEACEGSHVYEFIRINRASGRD